MTTRDNLSSVTDEVTTGKEVGNHAQIASLIPFGDDIVLVLLRVAEIYQTDDDIVAADQGKAVVRFLFPRTGAYIWDGETFLGTGWPSAQFDYYASPGKHIFFTTAENKAFLEADLDGSKTNYIIGRVWPGWMVQRVGLFAVNRGGEYWDKVIEWEQRLKRYELNPEWLAKYEAEHKERMRALLAEYDTRWKNEYNWPKLNREDGR